MLHQNAQSWLEKLEGWLGPDAYSTAWVAMVPDAANLGRPAWPQALDYLRSHQLEDGGWGEPSIYYAHERTISTLAAIMALSAWQQTPEDRDRTRRGLAALRCYATDLAQEPHEPIGFELLLPRLRSVLAPLFGEELPLEEWAPIDAVGAEKLAIIRAMNPDPAVPQAWWFSMELLSEEQLSQLDDSLLDANGSVATSTAATAAYLRARRLSGVDSPRAAKYLAKLLDMGKGSVPVGWPFELFERIWALDSFRRSGFDPGDPAIVPIAEGVYESWNLNEPGLSYSDVFPVNDGDETVVGYTALAWANLTPPEEPLMAFWDSDHFRTYLDERHASVSVNIHALTALRLQSGFPHRDLAEKLTEWLMVRMNQDVIFEDKWHLSPYYSVARAIHAFAGWNDEIANQCVTFLTERQAADGGWGGFGRSTLEETAYCVIGLCHAYQQGLLTDAISLTQAAEFFQVNAKRKPLERLWIGKALYRPDGIVEVTIFAAKAALRRLGFLASDTNGGAEVPA